jgi:hypothetical protein
MTFPVPTLARHIAALAVFGHFFAVGCAAKDDKGSNTNANAPCLNELKGECGEECSSDTQCGNFLYCGGEGICTSDCTEAGKQCTGDCEDGRCVNGVLVNPQMPPANSGAIIVSPGSTGGTGGITEGCATDTSNAMLSDVNMYIMFDQSLSMLDDNKWPDATDALVDFLQDQGTNGLNIALRFFPSNLPVAGCVDENAGEPEFCQAALCEQPLVNIGLVDSANGDTQRTALVSAINDADPGSGIAGAINADGSPNYQRGGGTPISAALGGAIDWSVKYQASHPDQKTVVVFVTDGEPHGCDESTNAISAIAADGAQRGIPTYSIGLDGSAPALMRAIATAGGTGDPFMIGSGANSSADLLNALNQIRGSAVACDFVIPNSARVNPNLVNVTLTTGGTTGTLVKVNTEADCGDNPTSGEWYYDNNQTPTRVILCQNACDSAGQDGSALKVVFGCTTQTGVNPT